MRLIAARRVPRDFPKMEAKVPWLVEAIPRRSYFELFAVRCHKVNASKCMERIDPIDYSSLGYMQ